MGFFPFFSVHTACRKSVGIEGVILGDLGLVFLFGFVFSCVCLCEKTNCLSYVYVSLRLSSSSSSSSLLNCFSFFCHYKSLLGGLMQGRGICPV